MRKNKGLHYRELIGRRVGQDIPAQIIYRFQLSRKKEIAREYLRMLMEEPEYKLYVDNMTGNWWDRDTDDFMLIRIKALELYLQANPYDMLDCDEMNQLPMEIFQEVGSYQVPPEVVSRIDNIRDQNAPNYTTSNFRIQKIQDASGGTVNCDYFTVKIDQLPKQSGVTMTSDQLLEHFRKNIDDFIGSGINVSFQPYIHFIPGEVNVDETTKFNQAYHSSIGALVHIDMVDDGTVVQSGYFSDSGHHHFTFTTMKTPLDFAHPVAGNRRFGIFPYEGSYYFYIMGVDRTNDKSTTLANVFTGIPFTSADELWQSVQQGMKTFVNSNQGTASTIAQQVARVRWDILKEFLLGKVAYEEFRNLRNCQ